MKHGFPLLPLYVILLAALLLLALAGMLEGLPERARQLGMEEVPWRALLAPAPPDDPALTLLHTIVWQTRLPRVLLAILVGAALALSGTAMQAVFQNPLAEPYIVGVAGGAGLGAAISVATGIGASWGPFDSNPLFVFLGGMGAALVVYALAHRRGHIAIVHLLLIGVAMSALCGGLTSYLLWFQADLQKIIFLLMGTLERARLADVGLLAIVVLLGVVGLQLFARALDALQLGDDRAGVLGLHVTRVRQLVLVVGVVLASTAVMVSGVIGFVGLIAPHVMRLLVGPRHHRLLPAAALGGATLLLAADVAIRLTHRAEVPVGIFTTFLGVPFFLYLLRRGRI